MITTVLAGTAGLSAVLAIAAEWEERRHPAFYLLKPLTTALILAAVLTLAPASGAAYRQWVLVALALSLVGDVCLMFKGDLWFAGGLGSFLVAHLFFILAFAGGVRLGWPPPWTALLLVYGLGLSAWLLPRAGALRIPVAVYCLVLLGMALTAALRLQQLGGRPALLAPAGLAPAALAVSGAIVFMLSDSLLAIRLVNRAFLLWVLLVLAFPFCLGVALTGSVVGGLTGLLWRGAVRILFLHHATFSINSLCHFLGRRRFRTGDESRNLAWLALPTFGEAWHNNHHAFQTSAHLSLASWQLDPRG